MNNAAEPGMALLHLELRRARLLDSVSRPLEPVAAGGDPLPPDGVQYLLREAQDLYWNELAWEELMEEEAVVGGRLTELVFPAFLAFVDGLLLDRLPRGVPGTPRPRPEVVEEILLFLAERYAEFSHELGNGADSQRLVWARAMTTGLIDLVLYRLYRLSSAEREEIETVE
jgi:hypothetical protein